ncbi:hypothetical protein IFR05_016489 [Cadophora sp. M221]|nr:hypothetical protein IFR05_016489 [Cadophora sp. M221]
MAPPTLCPREIKNETARLESQFRTISTRPEIAEISLYLSRLGVSTQYYIKNEAIRSFIDSKPDSESLWREIDSFRMMDETSKFFLDDTNVDLPTLCEIQGAVQIWSHLVVAGGMDMVLSQYPDIDMVRRRGGSPAEIFRECLYAHQLEEDFEFWDENRMNVFRLRLFEFDQDLRLTKREDLSLDLPLEKTNRPDVASGAVAAKRVEDSVPSLVKATQRRVDIIDLTGDDIDMSGLPVMMEQSNEPDEALYSASPPPQCRTPTLVSLQPSILSISPAKIVPLTSNEREPDFPALVNGSLILQLNPESQNHELPKHPIQTNTQKLEAHLLECEVYAKPLSPTPKIP